MNKKKKNIQELLNYLTSREKLLNSPANVKKFTTLCNTLTITLIHQKAIPDALKIASKGLSAVQALSVTYKAINIWPGKTLTLNLLGYIYYKQNKLTESLKVLYESQLLLQTSKESQSFFSLELYILTNFLTYMTLWKISRKQESLKYLEIVRINILSIQKGATNTRFPRVSIDNFYGILCYSLALMRIELEGNYKSAKHICEETLSHIGDEVLCRNLLGKVLARIVYIEKNPYGVVECDICEEFEDIFFISIVLPMKSTKIPEINIESVDNLKARSSSGSKRPSSRSSRAQDLLKLRGNSLQYSPSSRPKSGKDSDKPGFNLTRPRSSNGYVMNRRINKIYM